MIQLYKFDITLLKFVKIKQIMYIMLLFTIIALNVIVSSIIIHNHDTTDLYEHLHSVDIRYIYYKDKYTYTKQTSEIINNTDITMKHYPIPIDSVIRIASPFGYRMHPIYHTMRFHSGIDIVADKGTVIHSTMPGKVIKSYYSETYGNVIYVETSIITIYAHLSNRIVNQGDKIQSDDVIGIIGNTGTSTGIHLHYEVRLNNIPQNPLTFL